MGKASKAGGAAPGEDWGPGEGWLFGLLQPGGMTTIKVLESGPQDRRTAGPQDRRTAGPQDLPPLWRNFGEAE